MIQIDSDHTRRPDAFRRRGFAERIAPLLCRGPNDEAVVVGLEGEWGSGKTHLLRQVRNALSASHPDAVVVDFNPWLIASTESLVLALLGQLAARIGTVPNNSRTEQAGRGLAVSRRLLGYLSALQRVAEPALLLLDPSGTSSGLVAATRRPIDTVSKAIDDAGLPVRLAKADVFACKQAVEEALREFNQPVIVIVDDLDRLQDNEVRSVFQAVKAVADFPGIGYLIAYDRKRVAKAFDGDSYVEKIVQVAYPVPHLHFWDKVLFTRNEIAATMAALHCEIPASDSGTFDKAVRIAARLCRHPRDVVRLCNRLRISISAFHSSINPADIIVVEALALTCPSVAEAMRHHQMDFSYHPHPRDDKEAGDDFVRYFAEELSRENREPLWQKHIPATASNKEDIAKALDFLFLSEPGMVVPSSSGLERRLRVPELLAEYLQLEAVDGVPSPAAIDDMLASPEHLANALDEAGEDVLGLLGWIAKYFPQQPLSDSKAFLDQFLALTKGACQAPARLHKLLGDIALYLVKSSLSDERPKLMSHLIDRAPLGTSERAVLEIAKEHGRVQFRNREQYMRPEDQRIIASSTEVAALIDQWRNKLRRAVHEQSLSAEPNFVGLLHRWHQLGDPTYTELWQLTKLLCNTKEGLEGFVRHLRDDADEWKWSDVFEAHLTLTWDPKELAQMLEQSNFGDRYSRLRTRLTSSEATEEHRKLLALGEAANNASTPTQ